MNRTRLLNMVAIGLIVLLVIVFAAAAIPGVGQQEATSEPGTPTAEGTEQATEAPVSVPIDLPVQIGSISLTRDISFPEALASAVPNPPSLEPFTAPTPMYSGGSYIMTVDEARNTLGADPLIPTYVRPTYAMSGFYGASGMASGNTVTMVYNTDGYQNTLVINEILYNAESPQVYPVGNAQAFSVTVRGTTGVYLDQANLGWNPDGAIWVFNALLWEENGLVIRMMSDSLPQEELIAVAETMNAGGTPQTNQETATPTPTPSAWDMASMYVPEVPVLVTLPAGYEPISYVDEPNRLGSIAAFHFLSTDDKALSYLNELHFFTYDSIKAFNVNCESTANCGDGYPTIDLYIQQLEAFTNNTPLEGYERMTLGAHDYLVSVPLRTGDGPPLREYTTFIRDVKVDVTTYSMAESDEEIAAADALISQIIFDAENAPQPTPTTPPEPITFNLGEAFDLPMGQVASLADQDFSVQIGGIQDSRCPMGPQCVTGGLVIVDLIVTIGGNPMTVTLELVSEPVSTIVEGYEITLHSVEPYPIPGVVTNPIYKITLTIDQPLTN